MGRHYPQKWLSFRSAPTSLVVPYDLNSMRQHWPAHLKRGTLVRFSTGLESVADLQADLAQALAAALPA